MISAIIAAALAITRSVELSILVKATILLLLAVLVTALASRARASIRHLILTVTFGGLLALPVVVLNAPALMIEVPDSPPSIAATAVAPAPHVDSLSPTPERMTRSLAVSWTIVIRLMWIAGISILFLRLAIDLWRLRRIRRRGLPWMERREFTKALAIECGVRRSVEVLLHEDLPAPLTYGLFRPAILLPIDARQWSDADLRRALVHELEHVRRGDWAIQLMARVACACYFFHPFVWMAWRRLCVEAERACDDAVVRSTSDTEYAEQLVFLAQRMSQAHAPAPGMAHRSDLSTRVSAILDVRQSRGRASFLWAACAMIVASLVVSALAPARAVAQQQPGSSSSHTVSWSRLGSALYEAAQEGDIAEVERLVNAGADVNAKLLGDGSPLIAAARKGHLAIVRLLLDRGADPNMPVSGDGNPLIVASSKGHADVAALLLDRGARVDEAVPGDENALIQASGAGQLRVVKLLVLRGANVNARIWAEQYSLQSAGEWRTPLSMARKRGNRAVVDFLLSAGARE